MKNRTYYYTNDQTDEVVNFNIKKKIINEKYQYSSNNIVYKMWCFFIRIVIFPFGWLYYKIINPTKINNIKAIKSYKNGTFFIYSNHTNQYLDAFAPSLICFPKTPKIIVNADNVSIPFLGQILKMCGAIPVPDTFEASKNFYSEIEKSLTKNPIVIYPEAHLWPYYTKIRQFPATSFRYPIKFNKPIFIFTTVYKLRKHNKKPKIEIFIDGPIFPNLTIPDKRAQYELRDKAYSIMKNRSKNSNYEYIKYIKRTNND